MSMHAWDNADFVKTVRATGRETLIVAGVWASVCVMFSSLDAKVAGFKMFAVMDASGDPSEMALRTTLARLSRATTNAVLSEVHWRQTNMLECSSPQKLGIDGNDHRAKRHQHGADRR
jgi:isochorismate hydrolase